jgi:hypothetical protein
MERHFEGAKYDSKLTRKEISALIKAEIKDTYPQMNISVTSSSFSGGWSIDVTIKDFGFNPFTQEWLDVDKRFNDTTRSWQYIKQYTPRAEKIREDCDRILNQYNYDDSNPMIDYFSVNYYAHLRIDQEHIFHDYVINKKVSKPEKSPVANANGSEKVQDIVVRKNERQQGIEVLFPQKPSDASLAWLKDNKFRWNKPLKLWYVKFSEPLMKKTKAFFKVNNDPEFVGQLIEFKPRLLEVS